MQHHKYSLADVESIIPWERDIYLTLLNQHIEEENKRIEEQNQKMERSK